MLIVRDTFTAKAGQASKLAKVFKSAFDGVPNARVMTDLIGEYNTVVLELQVKSLAEYEGIMEGYKAGKPAPGMKPDAFDDMKGYTDLYLTGRREIFQIVD